MVIYLRGSNLKTPAKYNTHMPTLNIWTNPSNNNQLLLDSSTSIILPAFDTSSIIRAGVSKIVLSIYLKKINKTESRVHVTINPINEGGHVIGDGLPAELVPKINSYINLDLPVSLFEGAIGSQVRLLIKLVSPNVSMVFEGPDKAGTTNDPKLLVVYSDPLEDGRFQRGSPPMNNFITNNFYGNISNSQINSGVGEMLQVNHSSENKLISKIFWFLIVPIAVGIVIAKMT